MGRVSAGGHDAHTAPAAEDDVIAGAIRTDLVLSAEIMVIALNEVADEAFVPRLIILIVVAVLLTIVVYGVVAVIVKMDDVGLHLTSTASRPDSGSAGSWSRVCRNCCPRCRVPGWWRCSGSVDTSCSTGRSPGLAPSRGPGSPRADDVRHAVGSVGGVLAWMLNAGVSTVIGLIVGFLAFALVALLSLARRGR